jgi:CRP/FNR family transcriptional regulator, cyclic AMP receptor protein
MVAALCSRAMPSLLDACRDLPTKDLRAGEILVAEQQPRIGMFVVVSGVFEVSRLGSVVATISDPGAVIGEISVLLDTDHGATVTARTDARVHVISDVDNFLAADNQRLLEIARMLARRLNRLTGYLSDVRSQYAQAGGHLGLLEEVLSELTFGQHRPVEPGSERDPDPLY